MGNKTKGKKKSIVPLGNKTKGKKKKK